MQEEPHPVPTSFMRGGERKREGEERERGKRREREREGERKRENDITKKHQSKIHCQEWKNFTIPQQESPIWLGTVVQTGSQSSAVFFKEINQ